MKISKHQCIRARNLTSKYDSAVVREGLVYGLSDSLLKAEMDGDEPRGDSLLAELRSLVSAYDDPEIQQVFAYAIVETLHAVIKGNPRRKKELLGLLSKRCDVSMLETVAIKLFSDVSEAQDRRNLLRRDILLDLLRTLARSHEVAAFREQLAKALFNLVIVALAYQDYTLRNALLHELRTLAAGYSEVPIHEAFAKALVNVMNHAQNEGERSLRDHLLKELRSLQLLPAQLTGRDTLVRGFENTLRDAQAIGNWELEREMRTELKNW